MCEPWELYATACITASSNLFMIPCVIIIWRQVGIDCQERSYRSPSVAEFCIGMLAS